MESRRNGPQLSSRLDDDDEVSKEYNLIDVDTGYAKIRKSLLLNIIIICQAQ